MTHDREVARLLAVSPSPEFVARVRQRVASEPPPRRHVPVRAVLAATAAVACAAAIAAARLPHEASIAWPAPASRTTVPPAAATEPVKPALPFAQRAAPTAPATLRHAARQSDFVPVPAMTYHEIEPQRGERPVAEMQVHAVPPIETAGGERPWSTL